jgi:hypothetical protein
LEPLETIRGFVEKGLLSADEFLQGEDDMAFVTYPPPAKRDPGMMHEMAPSLSAYGSPPFPLATAPDVGMDMESDTLFHGSVDPSHSSPLPLTEPPTESSEAATRMGAGGVNGSGEGVSGGGGGGVRGGQEDGSISIANDVISVPEGSSVKSRLAVSFAIAQSAVLAVFEARIESKIAEYKYIPETLAKNGKVRLSPKQLGTMIGEVFVIRHDVNLHSEILDKPDFFWYYNDRIFLHAFTYCLSI